MLIGGLQKTTTLDYPGLLACTVFTVGCNFRCSFCHNKFLVTLQNFKESEEREIPKEEFFLYLQKRRGLLDGVCVTGGEPTLHPDLPDFCQRIKDLGFRLKLDTNGTNPEMLVDLFRSRLVDYVAMDLKTCFDDYPPVVGCSGNQSEGSFQRRQDDIKRSVKLILTSGVDFEFRTTVVPSLHTKLSLLKLAKDIKQAADTASVSVKKVPWYLQNFRPNNCLDSSFNEKDGFSEAELLGFVEVLRLDIPLVELRA